MSFPTLLRSAFKPLLFALLSLPLWLVLWRFGQGDIGVDPVATLTTESGTWGLRCLFLSLSLTPCSRLLSWPALLSVRRMVGLFSFFYLSLHLLVWLWFEHVFDAMSITMDILKRPFVTVGFFCFLLLAALAVTSNRGMMRRLGKWWKALHRWVYIAAVLAILHYIWLVKADLLQPLLYLLWLYVLFCYRMGYNLLSFYRVNKRSI